MLGVSDRASSLKDRDNTHLGPSGIYLVGSTPSTDACRASPRRSAPDNASAAPAPAGAGAGGDLRSCELGSKSAGQGYGSRGIANFEAWLSAPSVENISLARS